MANTSEFAKIKTMIHRAAHPPTAQVLTAETATGHALTAATPEDPDESTPSRSWTGLIDDLLAIRNLQDDWDGQGAQAPSSALVDGAIRFAQGFQTQGIEPADRVIASVNGTVYFEWHRRGGYVEIEVTAPDAAEARAARTGSKKPDVVRLSRSL